MDLNTLNTVVLAIFVYFNIFFVLAKVTNDYSVIDFAWGGGFFVVFLSSFDFSLFLDRNLIVGLLVFLWALRLSVYIFLRNKKTGEDFRYSEWRRSWPNHTALNFYFRVYLLQAFLLLVVASPLYLINQTQFKTLNFLDYIGIFIFVLGLSLESLADFQKSSFKSVEENKDEVCDVGLWRYSRHPNYFGECLLWWGIFLMNFRSEYQLLSLIGPAVLTFLILKVSGIPLLEKKHAGNKKYQLYRKRTSVFIPWFPKRENI